jgi:uncharacterized membrane protein
VDALLLAIIIFIGLIFRLYKVNTPLADLHSWRQVDTAAVAKNFVNIEFDLFHPRYDDLSDASTGLANPQGYRFVEFPLYNAIFAYIYKILPVVPLEVYGRLVSILFSLFAIAFVYYLALKESGRNTAVTASAVFAVFPFFVFFSRTVLPETMATSLALTAVFFLYLFANSQKRTASVLFFFVSLIAFAISILVKPPAVFYGISLLFIFFEKYRFSIIKKIPVYLYFILSLLPFFLWRQYIQSYPEGVPPSEWLITSVNTYEGLKNIFFKPAYFRWIYYERINNYMLGGYLSFLLLLGIIAKPKKWFLHFILLSAVAYLLVFQGGNVQHEYYQTVILPAIAIFVGLGVNFILTNKKIFISHFIIYPLLIAVFSLSFFFSFYKVRDYYHYPEDLTQIAKIVSTLTSKDDLVVTDRLGDTTLLYLAGRRGSPALSRDLEEFKNEGYRYFVTQKEETIEANKLKYKVVFENDKFALFAL